MKKLNLLSMGLYLLTLFALEAKAVNINIGSNGCLLKDAIRSANADAPRGNCSAGSGADIIIAPDGWLVVLDSTLPTITSDITFQSATTDGIFYISGDNSHRIMEITGTNNTVHFKRVHLINAKSNFLNGAGGALYVLDATVQLSDSLIGSAYVADVSGSAIAIYDGTLIINLSTIINNDVESTGAPSAWTPSTIYAVNTDVEVIDSSFKHNSNTSIYMNGGELTVSGSLFFDLRSELAGQGVVVDITNSTFTPSPSEYDYSALYFDESSFIDLNHNTILGKMSANDSILSISNSIYGKCYLDNTNLLLNSQNVRSYGGIDNPPFNCLPNNERISGVSVLSDNGGPTDTRALPYSSIAVNAGDTNHCLAVDQRGENRIGVCDIGAFEVTAIADVETEIDFSRPAPYVGSQSLTAFMRVINNGPGDASAIEVELDTEHVFIQAIDSTQCTSFPCTIAYLGAGQEAYIPVELVTGNPFNSPMTLTLEASSTQASSHEDPDEDTIGENNLANLNLAINEGSDMAVAVELITPPPYFTNQILDYQATISNAGQSTATQAQFYLQGLGLGDITYTGCSSINGQNCIINSLLNGGTKVINITAIVTQAQFDAIGTISSDQVDINLTDNIDDQQNNGAVADADIKVNMEIVQAAPYYSYQYLEFNITITAIDDATNIQLWTEFPGAEYIGIGFCPSIPCVIPSMAAGTSVQTTFQLFAPIADPGVIDSLSHRVFATPGQYDPNLSDNEVIITLPLNAASDTSVNLDLISAPPFYVGQEVEYDLTVFNGGPNDLTDVQVVDTPENLTLLWTAGQSCQTLDCSIDEIDLFQNENMTLMYRIDQIGEFDLSISALANEIDEYPNNNSDSSANGGTATLVPNDLIFKDGFE